MEDELNDYRKKCDGNCLLQLGQNKHYREIDCPDNCQPIKCPNYLLCGQAYPRWLFWHHSNRCSYCNESFGCDLTFIEKEECSVCMMDKSVFIRWGCIHDFCVDCFRKNHGWNDWFLQGPTDDSALKVHNAEECKAYMIQADQEEAEYNAAHPIILDENGREIDSPPVERPKWFGQCPLCRHREFPSWRKKQLGL